MVADAASMIEGFRRDGHELRLDQGGRLVVRNPGTLPNSGRDTLKRHKAAIVSELWTERVVAHFDRCTAGGDWAELLASLGIPADEAAYASTRADIAVAVLELERVGRIRNTGPDQWETTHLPP